MKFGLVAQDASDSTIIERPKIGLVLSGGAAHGFAHIGVLMRLEELGIPIDYITGTSMGAVVGGLYAMGYSASEILTIAEQQDWSLILRNAVPLEEISSIEKRHHQKNPFHLVWNGESFDLPSGVLGGQKMDLILSRLYCPAHFIEDYDDLPIPFRCIAVDIVNGDIVTFSRGYIGKSIRASMAIPSIFPAVEVDNHLFVDGGLLRNFPVEENIELGSDILIGSYVGADLKEKDELFSLVDVLTQSTSLPNYLDAQEQAKLLDVMIVPEVKDFSSFDFDSFKSFTELGYKAAIEAEDALIRIRDQLKPYDTSNQKGKLTLPEQIKVNKIVLHTANRSIRQLILGILSFSEGDVVSLEQIEKGASEVYGTNYFSKVSYDFFIYGDGVGLELITEEKEPFKIGLSYNRFENYSSSLILNAEFRNIFFKPSRIHLTTRISTDPALEFLYQYRLWNNPSYVLQSRFILENFDLPYYRNGQVDRRYSNNQVKLDLGLMKEIGKSSYYSLYYAFNFNRITPQINPLNDFNLTRTIRQSLGVGYNFNTMDNQAFTSSGEFLTLDLKYNFLSTTDREWDWGEENLDFLEEDPNISFRLIAKKFFSLSEAMSFNVQSSLAYNTSETLLANYRLGGTAQAKNETVSFIGVNDGEYILGSHVSLNATFQYHLGKYFYLSPKFSAVYGNDLLDQVYDDVENLWLLGTGMEFGINTPIGPWLIDIGYSFRDNGLVANMGVGYRHIY